MNVLIAGAGIGGLAAALALHRAGIEAEIVEQARQLTELGVGINLLPHGTKELADLGVLPALDRAGIRTRELIYCTRLGQTVWRDLRGCEAGYEHPQLSIHRGRLHRVLLDAVRQRIGAHAVQTDSTVIGFDDRHDLVVARVRSRATGEVREVRADVLLGCDGVHSAVRAALYPKEGPPTWSGIMLWRGAVDWPVYEDGRTMVIAGGNAAKFVCYPIVFDSQTPGRRLTNWGVMARVAEPGAPPPVQDWKRHGRLEDATAFVRDAFRLPAVDPQRMIEATDTFYEYPNCDRDPLPRWSFGRVTLLGDAAHPMYPVGSNGASQAILDACAVARHLSSGVAVTDALAAYDQERRPATSEIILKNRTGGPEQVIDLVESRAPDGFTDLDTIAPYPERESIVRGYARVAGYALGPGQSDRVLPRG